LPGLKQKMMKNLLLIPALFICMAGQCQIKESKEDPFTKNYIITTEAVKLCKSKNIQFFIKSSGDFIAVSLTANMSLEQYINTSHLTGGLVLLFSNDSTKNLYPPGVDFFLDRKSNLTALFPGYVYETDTSAIRMLSEVPLKAIRINESIGFADENVTGNTSQIMDLAKAYLKEYYTKVVAKK
jgi:hypothetical protein